MDTNQVQIQLDDARRQGNIEAIVTDMHHRLFGNGQPGELDKLGQRMNKMDEDLDELKETKAKGKAVFWTLGTIFSLLGGTELWHLFKK